MEEFYNLLCQYAVFPVALVCFGVGYIIKHYITKLPNKYIPLILACLGLLLNLAINGFHFSLSIIITGIASGLVATGSFEMVRNLVNKDKKDKQEKQEKQENQTTETK